MEGAGSMSKEDFTNRPNPAEEEAPKPSPVKKAEKKPSRQETERKSKRVNLLMQPSVMEDLQKIATMRRTSVNDLINSVMKEYAASQRALVAQYDTVFEE